MMPIRIARVCPYFYGKRENLDSGLKPYYFNIIKEMSKYKLPNDIYTEETDSKDSPNVFTIKKIRIKSLGSFKDMLYFYIFNRYICKRADAIITVSSEAKNEIIEKFHINKDKVFMIPTAVDTSIFKKTNSKKDIDLLYVGRFAVKKNITNLIDIVSNLKKNFPDIN